MNFHKIGTGHHKGLRCIYVLTAIPFIIQIPAVPINGIYAVANHGVDQMSLYHLPTSRVVACTCKL